MKSVPLFSCETYEIYSTTVLGVVLRFGAYAGHVIKFKVCGLIYQHYIFLYCHYYFDLQSDQIEPRDTVTLTCEEWGMLHCKRIQEDPNEENFDSPFSLLPALEDGYFADIKITASNNKEFKIHSCITQLLGNDIPWQATPHPFTGLSEDVLGTILLYIYAECLPENLTENTAKQVIKTAAQYPSLGKLVNMCQMYLKNMALKQRKKTIELHNKRSAVAEICLW